MQLKRKLPNVNCGLAARILENEEVEDESKDVDDNETKKKSKKKKGLGSDDFKDERFVAMFEIKDYEIAELSYEYLALHPLASQKQPSLVKEHFKPVMEDEDQSASDSDVSAASQLYEVKDEWLAKAFWNRVSLAKEDALPMGERLKALQNDRQASGLPSDVKLGPGGWREISFITRNSAKYEEDKEDKEAHHVKRRGIQSLGLKTR
ncbi:hypothetical protein Patl1_05478 [Pistacia atlantica]|uniref:Uncharacterized protein n=1 Tax=Pistacia atlantica TaxID=434234 RepID=A0ACC1BTU5_9ROSI|nr:hypothetical protein Patl1_05478 [Pistacia atlantica]